MMGNPQHSDIPVASIAMCESNVLSLAVRPGGWVIDRLDLPESAESRAVDLMADILLPGMGREFRRFLRQIFTTTVERETARFKFAARYMATGQIQSLPDGQGQLRKKKFPAQLLDRLQHHRECYHVLKKRKKLSLTSIGRYFENLYGERGLFWVLNALLMERSGHQICMYRLPGLRRVLFDALESEFDVAERCIRLAQLPGPSVPAFEQMARAVIALHFACTGAIPRRTWNPYGEGDRDTGHCIEVCRLLASAVNEALPTEFRRPKPVKMSETARRMMKEFKAELAAA